MSADLTGKRVLVLGAETEVGRAVTAAVAEAGADVALVAATSDAEAAFAVQRLARRLSTGERRVISQAIDATNETAVRVMMRQVSKAVGGLDGVVLCLDLGDGTPKALDVASASASKELQRRGDGALVWVWPTWIHERKDLDWPSLSGREVGVIVTRAGELEHVPRGVVSALADALATG